MQKQGIILEEYILKLYWQDFDLIILLKISGKLQRFFIWYIVETALKTAHSKF